MAIAILRRRSVPWLVVVPAIWIAIAFLTSLQNYVANIAAGQPQPWLPALGYGLIWWSAWAMVTPVPVLLARRFGIDQRHLARFAAVHLAGGVATAVLHAGIYALLFRLFVPRGPDSLSSIDLLVQKLSYSIHVNLMVYFIIVGIVVGGRAYRALRDRELDAARLEAQLAEAETAALRAQLQPHFLFNTLNAISALVPEDPVTAQRLIARLGDLLRLSMEQHHAQQSSLADEVEFTDAYLAIEEARLGPRLQIVRRFAPEAMSAQVPTLLLQPLVENAVRHGISPLVQGGTLTIEAVLVDSSLQIMVADDGKGAHAIVEGIGLGNSRSRLRQLYGDGQSLTVETTPGEGFRVTVLVPA